MKKLLAIILSLLLCFSVGCNKGEGGEDMKEQNIIPDRLWEQGFVLTGFDSRPEFGQRDIGRIDWGKEGLEPVWRLGQWGCLKNIADETTTHTLEDGFDVFRDGSKELKLNRTTGAFSLNVDATKDGVYANGPRKANEPWIHFIMEIPSFPVKTKVADLEYLTFYLEFQLTKSENHCGAEYNTGLHSAMFLWYVTLNDTVTKDYMWFGLPIYDNRSTFSSEFAQQDGGKEDSTTKFIYNPAGDTFLDLPVAVGVNNVLSRDMLPTIKYAFNLAQERGFMKDSKFENLAMSLMYIGWELPGTFDVGMDVYNMQLLAGKK